MKIYFSGSISGGRADAATYARLIRLLARHGQVLTEHVGREVPETAPLSAAEIWARDVDWLREADVVVAEVSAPSHGVGYELALAEQWGKPVLALHRAGLRVSAMLAGAPGVLAAGYQDLEEAEAAIESFLRDATGPARPGSVDPG